MSTLRSWSRALTDTTMALAFSLVLAGCAGANTPVAVNRVPGANPPPGAGGSKATSSYVIDDHTLFPYPTYAMPAKGTAVTDPTFGTTFQRLTQKAFDGYSSPAITPEYAKADPSNATGTRVVLEGTDGSWYLYDTNTFALLNGGPIPNLPQDAIEPRWDAQDPNVFYYRQSADAIFRSFNITTNSSAVVHDFSSEIAGAVTILNDSEGDSSTDGRYWAFEIRGNPPDSDNILGLVTYDRVSDKVIGKKLTPRGGIMPNWVGVDASGTHVIFPAEDNVHPMVSYHLDFSHAISLTTTAGHSDVAVDKNGRDVIVYQDNATDYISMADLETGAVTQLERLPFEVNLDTGIHISGNAVKKPGWALVTTGGSTYKSWMDRQFWMLELKANPRVWRLGWTRLLQCDKESNFNYSSEGWATVNKAGTRLWWQSNNDVATCTSDNEDVFQMNLPEFPPAGSPFSLNLPALFGRVGN